MRPTLADIAKALNTTGGQYLDVARLASVRPSGGQTDSRQVRPGDMFFCLKGEHVDGHDYAAAAAKAGASAIIAERMPAGVEDGGVPVLLVEDSVKALGRAARLHRLASNATVVGITGTAGKTTVKEVLASILETAGTTDKNSMNLNNQIGLPISMLNARSDAAFWVMEAGISQARDMDELGEILQPDAALIINAGQGHLTGLGDKGAPHYKARFLDYIRPGGRAFVSADYPGLNREVESRIPALSAQEIRLTTFTAADAAAADCSAYYEGLCREDVPDGAPYTARGRYRVDFEGHEYVVEAPFTASYGSENVAAVFCAAVSLGMEPDAVCRAFAGAKLPAMRFAVEKAGDFLLINDSYNANPLSAGRMVEAAYDMAAELDLPLFLVMGDMLELGAEEKEAHVTPARKIAQLAPQRVFWKGGAFEYVGHGLALENFNGEYVPVSSERDFLENLNRHAPAPGLVLFKGSRSNRLELFVEAFRSWACEKEKPDA